MADTQQGGKQPGSRRQSGYPTIKDISQHAGVSKSLVSRALRGEGHVRDSTRQRMRQAKISHGHDPRQPNALSCELSDHIRIHIVSQYLRQ